ncbi:MAG: hypothetical protein DCC71_09255 [Proteobacteria bacterium]|nr:MAG: hypothetical protein DCC71_09255 [Pseudomonadota bacterium]
MPSAKRFPFPSDPAGWYHVAESCELADGSELRVTALGRALRVWRDGCGGAHAARDGRGELPVDEVNGSVLVYWDPLGRAPTWRIPPLAACTSPDWRRTADRAWRLRSHPQEIGENVVDTAHILVLHGAPRLPVLDRAEADGPFFRVESRTPADDPAAAFVSGFRVTEHGLGYAALEFEGAAPLCAIARRTPAYDDVVDVRVAFFAARGGDAALADTIGAAFVERFCAEFDADVPILEHKAHLAAPLLCEGDGPIAAWRRFCRQFYA